MSAQQQYEPVDLSAYDDEFVATPEPERQDVKVPDGVYTVEVTGVEFKKSQTSGKDMLAWRLKIVDPGPFNNVILRRFNMLEYLDRLKKDLRTCGIQVERLSSVKLDLLIGVRVMVKVVNKEENQNVYINKLVPKVGDDGNAAEDGPLPF